MEQRDLIKDQIEQLGKVLAKILSNFLGVPDKNTDASGIEFTNEQLKSELDIDIDKILSFSKEELKDYLKSLRLTENHIETLSTYFEEIGRRTSSSNQTQSAAYLEKAIELLEITHEISNTISLERMARQNELKNMLKDSI